MVFYLALEMALEISEGRLMPNDLTGPDNTRDDPLRRCHSDGQHPLIHNPHDLLSRKYSE